MQQVGIKYYGTKIVNINTFTNVAAVPNILFNVMYNSNSVNGTFSLKIHTICRFSNYACISYCTRSIICGVYSLHVINDTKRRLSIDRSSCVPVPFEERRKTLV